MTRLLILILLLGVLFLVYWYHDKFIGAPENTNNKDQNQNQNQNGGVIASGIQGSDKKITKLKFSKNKNTKPIKKKIEFIDPETESDDDITFGSYDSKSDDSDDESYKHKRNNNNNKNNNKNREDDSCDDSNDDDDEDYDEKSNMSGYSNFTLSDLK